MSMLVAAAAFTATSTTTKGGHCNKQLKFVLQLAAASSSTEREGGGPTNVKRRTWDENYALLVKYHEQYGHANVPGLFHEDLRLGRWLKTQRKRRAKLSADRINKLNALGVNWGDVCGDKYEQRWQTMFQVLIEYKATHGDCNVPTRWKQDQKLANWVSYQRKDNTRDKLAPHRIQQLESIGFVWRLKEYQGNKTSNNWEQQWDSFYGQLVQFQQKHGHCNVRKVEISSSPTTVEERLGRWASVQRQNHAAGQLREDRKRRLDELGFVWSFDEEKNDIQYWKS